MTDFSLTELNDKISKESVFVKPLMDEIGKVIVGQNEVVTKILIGLLSNGHILLEGVPGLAKTTIVKTVAQLIDTKFQRVQFTPDMLPADLIGTLIYNQKTGGFETKQGPIFANIILADEINRSPAKVQSALLEAMQEHRVTAAGISHMLDEPFLVLATQNPIEQEGTYPLPEAQLDRFMFSLNISYPSREEEIDIVKSTTAGADVKLDAVVKKEDLLTFQSLVRRVPVADNVVEYAVKLSALTRPNDGAPKFITDWLEWGAGPRASQYLILGAKAKAILDGRPTPDISDVVAMAKPVLRHRIITSFNAEADGVNADQVLDRLIEGES